MPQSLPNTNLFLFTAEDQRQAIVDLVSRCNQIVYRDKAVLDGAMPWERVFSWSAVEQRRDGITLEDYGVPTSTAALLYCLPTPLEKAVIARTAKAAMGAYPKQLAASPIFGVIAVRDRYSLSQSLQAGRLWERAHLLATSQGVAARPVNEAIELHRYRERGRASSRHGAQAERAHRRLHLATHIHVSHGIRDKDRVPESAPRFIAGAPAVIAAFQARVAPQAPLAGLALRGRMPHPGTWRYRSPTQGQPGDF